MTNDLPFSRSKAIKTIVKTLVVICVALATVEVIDLPWAEARSSARTYGKTKKTSAKSTKRTSSRRGSSSRKKSSSTSQGGGRYPSATHNKEFMSTCTDKSVPTIYNPNIEGRMEGGKRNRHGEKITSIEDAAKTGRPVTVAMDIRGEFGQKCNWKNSTGTQRRSCLLLVHLPGLDEVYPEYKKKFPNLPKDSFLAIVEDTGGAFYHKGTGKMDIPFRTNKLYRSSPFKNLSFEVLASLETAEAKAHRTRDMSHFSPFVNERKPKCSWGPSRQITRSIVNSDSDYMSGNSGGVVQ